VTQLAAVLILCFVAFGARAAEPHPLASIHKDIDRLAAAFSDGFGQDDRKRRWIKTGPLFGQDEEGAVAFFALSGLDLMNGTEEYMAVFARGQDREVPKAKEKPYRLILVTLIGTRWSRAFDWKSAAVRPGEISLKGLSWGEGDAGCCPTRAINVTFRLAKAEGADTRYPLLTEDERPIPSQPSK